MRFDAVALARDLQPMTGALIVLGAFAGVAIAVAITILRGWLVKRFAGPSPVESRRT